MLLVSYPSLVHDFELLIFRSAEDAVKITRAFSLIGVLTVCSCMANASPGCSTITTPNGPAAIRVPGETGFRFPTDQKYLLQLNAKQRAQVIRRHAWSILAGIVAHSVPGDPCSPPVWDTWFSTLKPDSDSKGLMPRLVSLDVSLETVAAFYGDGTRVLGAPATPSTFTQAQESALLPVVVQALHNVGEQKLYNPAAHSWIIKNQFQSPTALRDQIKALSNKPVDQRTILEFPRDSVIVKAKWQSITPDGPNNVWYWTHDSTADCRNGCFKEITVRKAASDERCNLPAKTGVEIRSTCFYTVNDDGEPGNSLILLGLHVMKKEIPDWTWTTFWWTPDSKRRSRFSADRFSASIIRGFWRNYLMDTTLSMITPWEKNSSLGQTPAEVDPCHQDWSQASKAKTDFNPYIEIAPDQGGGMLNAPLSNCMNCHKRSTYPGFANNNMRGVPWRGELKSATDCFADQMRLDYLWSLSPLDPNSRLGMFYAAVLQQLTIASGRLEFR